MERRAKLIHYAVHSTLPNTVFFFFTFLDINVTKPCFSHIISQTAQKNKRRENTSTRGYFNILKRNLSCLNYIVSVSRKTKKTTQYFCSKYMRSHDLFMILRLLFLVEFRLFLAIFFLLRFDFILIILFIILFSMWPWSVLMTCPSCDSRQSTLSISIVQFESTCRIVMSWNSCFHLWPQYKSCSLTLRSLFYIWFSLWFIHF